MKRKISSLLFALVLVLSLSFSLIPAMPAAAATLEVGPGKPYATIQAAVDAASAGDTILVYDGTYGGFNAYVQGITVTAASSPVISGTGILYGGQVVGVLVTADNVTIKGLIVTGQYSTGIWVVDGADSVQILQNTVEQTGFEPRSLSGVTWDGSAIQSHGDDTVISNNRVKFGPFISPHNGINVFYKDYTISRNTITMFQGDGPTYRYKVGINVRGNATVSKNTVICPDKSLRVWTRAFGIWLYGLDVYSPLTLTATVADNTVHKTDYAVWARGSKWTSSTIIEDNTLVNNGFGVISEAGAAPTIQNNRIKNSWWADIYP